MDDAHARRNDAEAAKRLLRPAQQCVALPVALVFARDVPLVRLAITEGVHLHRVIDDQVDRDQRIDPQRVAAGPRDRRSHRREVDHGRHAGEVLEQHPSWHEGALAVGLRHRSVPARDRFDIAVAHPRRGGIAQAVLEEDLHRHRQSRHVADAALGERAEAVICNAGHEFRPGAEGIAGGHQQPSSHPATGRGP